MEIRVYYQRVRDIERTIAEDYVIVVSLNTGDGGVEGRRTEVSRSAAARLIADGVARLASLDEAEEYRREQELARDEGQRKADAARLQVAIVRSTEAPPFRPGKKG